MKILYKIVLIVILLVSTFTANSDTIENFTKTRSENAIITSSTSRFSKYITWIVGSYEAGICRYAYFLKAPASTKYDITKYEYWSANKIIADKCEVSIFTKGTEDTPLYIIKVNDEVLYENYF